jgi:hypothetical protein
VYEIKGMLEEDKLFHFMNDLRLWVQSELLRHNVQTFGTMITATEKLLHFRGEPKAGPRYSEDAQVISSNKGRGRGRTKEIQRRPRAVKTMPTNRRNEREKSNFMSDLCQGALCKELSLEIEVDALEKACNPYIRVLQVLNIVMEGESMESQEQDEMKLCYVQTELYGKSVLAMVDNGVVKTMPSKQTQRKRRIQFHVGSVARSTMRRIVP